MVEISVVVVTLLDEDSIPSVQHLKSQEFDDYEIIVRDDPGICAARNAGIREANANKIVFIDDDAIPAEGYLQIASRALEQHAVVAGRVVHPTGTVVSEFPGHYDQGPTGKSTETIVGCNMAFRKDVFAEVGGFDEALQWGHDETELADRVLEEFDIYYEPEMVVEHSYADGVIDYWNKMYRFGPADVYYGTKREDTTWKDGLATMFGPSSYLSKSLYGTFVKSVGRIVRNISIAKTMVENTVRTGE
ncbi:glycosyltransferase family 2 protein [Haloarchaeobius sp. DFWS5]|uniref:glycosyltransferase family 2 protein n=1 Tax=Haloarchaeobius sp. DFWS5 TaxID=3446114 RepID=UPI003EBBF4CC